jgi:hypothetical protein
MRAAGTSPASASAAPVPSAPSASQAGLRPCSQVNRALRTIMGLRHKGDYIRAMNEYEIIY